eukprot:355405-Chlamydomonas_euryale.AAC.2
MRACRNRVFLRAPPPRHARALALHAQEAAHARRPARTHAQEDLVVRIEVRGMPVDCAKCTTNHAQRIGQLHVDAMYEFPVLFPEVALLLITLVDDNAYTKYTIGMEKKKRLSCHREGVMKAGSHSVGWIFLVGYGRGEAAWVGARSKSVWGCCRGRRHAAKRCVGGEALVSAAGGYALMGTAGMCNPYPVLLQCALPTLSCSDVHSLPFLALICTPHLAALMCTPHSAALMCTPYPPLL